MADKGTINKIKLGENEYSLDAKTLDGHESSYYQEKNITQTIDENSTDTEYPSAECVYELMGDIESILAQI